MKIHTFNGGILQYSSVICFRSFNGHDRRYDVVLIEISSKPRGATPTGLHICSLLDLHVTNHSIVGNERFILVGTIVKASDDFGYLPLFAASGTSGTGMLDDDNRLVGIIKTTTDTSEGIELREGVYSTGQLGRLYVSSASCNQHWLP